MNASLELMRFCKRNLHAVLILGFLTALIVLVAGTSTSVGARHGGYHDIESYRKLHARFEHGGICNVYILMGNIFDNFYFSFIMQRQNEHV